MAGFGVIVNVLCAVIAEAKTHNEMSVKSRFFMRRICLKLAGVKK